MMRGDRYRQVAALHAGCIDQGFLATLGVPFLELMYRAIDETTGCVLLVEEREGRVCGFVAGGTGMGPIYRCMLKRPLRLAWALLPSLVRPSRLVRILDILRYAQKPHALIDKLPDAELLSIAVSPEVRGGGIAETLYRRLERHLLAQGVMAFKITVGVALAPAHRFYTRMGAAPARQVEVHAGEASTIYVQTLARAVPGSLP